MPAGAYGTADTMKRPTAGPTPTREAAEWGRRGDTATIHIRRAKNGTPGIHGLQGDQLRPLRALRREHPHADFVFLSQRKAPLSVDGAQKLIERLGVALQSNSVAIAPSSSDAF